MLSYSATSSVLDDATTGTSGSGMVGGEGMACVAGDRTNGTCDVMLAL